jgi:hypothetical protein
MANSDPDRQAREQIAKAEEAEARDRATGMASLFDLRMVIGGLLVLYGVILTVMGLFASDDAKAKAAGININLWAGLVILAGGAIFLTWARLRPLKPEDLQGADTGRPNVEAPQPTRWPRSNDWRRPGNSGEHSASRYLLIGKRSS